MSSSQIFTLVVLFVATVLLMIVIVQLVNRRFISTADENKKESPEYGIWYAGTILSGGIVFWQTVAVIKETVESVYMQSFIIQNQKMISPFWASMKSSFLLLGMGAIWFLLCHYVTIAGIKLILGNKDDREELLACNTSYFITRSALQVALSFMLLPFFVSILRAFLPETVVAFYH